MKRLLLLALALFFSLSLANAQEIKETQETKKLKKLKAKPVLTFPPLRS